MCSSVLGAEIFGFQLGDCLTFMGADDRDCCGFDQFAMTWKGKTIFVGTECIADQVDGLVGMLMGVIFQNGSVADDCRNFIVEERAYGFGHMVERNCRDGAGLQKLL